MTREGEAIAAAAILIVAFSLRDLPPLIARQNERTDPVMSENNLESWYTVEMMAPGPNAHVAAFLEQTPTGYVAVIRRIDIMLLEHCPLEGDDDAVESRVVPAFFDAAANLIRLAPGEKVMEGFVALGSNAAELEPLVKTTLDAISGDAAAARAAASPTIPAAEVTEK